MVFTPVTELFLDGAWVDISSDVRQADGISISRGRSAEAEDADPSSCSLTIDNRSGDYSPRNPVGAYFGQLGRNTPLRVRESSSGSNFVALPGVFSSYVSTPDVAALDVTGDIDVRVDVQPRTWRPANQYGLARKWVDDNAALNNQGSWALDLRVDGTLRFYWTTTGAFSSATDATSTAAVPESSTRLSVRVTLDVNNGAAGRDVTFYTSPDGVNGTWTQLGSTVTQAGVTSIFNSSVPVEVGRTVDGSSVQGDIPSAVQGRVYGFQMRSGIAGSVVANPDFTVQDSGITVFTDSAGRVWTLNGSAVMVNPDARFHGEISAFPPRWDKTGRDVYSTVQAYGVLRRLGQGQTALESVMYRLMTSRDQVRAYWPCEDGDDAEEFASGLPGYPPMLHPSGETDNANYDAFKASAPLPLASGVQWTGDVPSYIATGETQVGFLMRIPSGGVASTATVCRVRASGSAPRWDLTVTTAGALRLQGFDSEDVQIADSGTFTSVNGKRVRVAITLDQDGADVDWAVSVQEVGVSSVSAISSTLASRTVGRVVRVGMNVGGVMTDSALGHITVRSTSPAVNDMTGLELVAYKGESATERIVRLCEEEGVPVSLVGDLTDAALLGPQLPGQLLDLLREAATADMGVLYEPRGHLGLEYRTRASMYAQDAALTLDYAAGTISGIEPVEDDDATRNDITVKRVLGSSARAVLESGPLSVQAPPDGVGRYDEEVEISLSRDDDLSNQASWRLHMGTVDEARYPVLGVNLAGLAFTTDTALVLNGTTPGRASTPDVAALDITGDLDLRVHVALDDWTPAATNELVSKYTTVGDQRSYMLDVLSAGTLRLVWSADGIANLTATSTVAPTAADGAALWVRVTLDVNNGAAGRDIKFYTSTDGQTWTQLGSTVTQAGVTSIFSGTATLDVGSHTSGTTNKMSGKVSAVEIRNGIAGTIVANPDFGAQAAGATSFADSTGLTWTVTSPATIATIAGDLFSTLTADATALDVGDRLVVTNMLAGVGAPGDIQQMAQGFTETLTPFEWLIDVNCTPASPWDVGRWDDSEGPGEARYSTDGTELSVALPSAGAALLLDGVSPGRASTPDAAHLDITGDLDLRAHVAMDDWTPAAAMALVGKYDTGGNRSYLLRIETGGQPRLFWSNDGTANLSATATASPTIADGEALWVRATLDVNNGAAGRDIRFYTSPNGADGTWTQLGATVTQAGVTSIFNGTAEVAVGAYNNGASDRLTGRVSAAEVRNGIDGTTVARPEFGAQPAGTTSFVDSNGNTWTVTSPATIADVPADLFEDAVFVTTATGPTWGNTDAPYDITIGGERMTVLTVTGTGIGQTFGVIRGVNGVVKAHPLFAEVQLFHPAVYAL